MDHEPEKRSDVVRRWAQVVVSTVAAFALIVVCVAAFIVTPRALLGVPGLIWLAGQLWPDKPQVVVELVRTCVESRRATAAPPAALEAAAEPDRQRQRSRDAA